MAIGPRAAAVVMEPAEDTLRFAQHRAAVLREAGMHVPEGAEFDKPLEIHLAPVQVQGGRTPEGHCILQLQFFIPAELLPPMPRIVGQGEASFESMGVLDIAGVVTMKRDAVPLADGEEVRPELLRTLKVD